MSCAIRWSGVLSMPMMRQLPRRRRPRCAMRPSLRRWVQAAQFAPAELTIRFVDAAEGRALNRDYRGKDYATNVLTFAYNEGEEASDDDIVRADIVLCTDVLLSEAAAQGLSMEQHAAHLVVHGVLHAQGYDRKPRRQSTDSRETKISNWQIPNASISLNCKIFTVSCTLLHSGITPYARLSPRRSQR